MADSECLGPGLTMRSRIGDFPRVLRARCCSTDATLKFRSLPNDSLFRRISPLGPPDNSMVPVLDQWVDEGRPVSKEELVGIIKYLKSQKRLKHALQISEWMTNRIYPDISVGDAYGRLELISKVDGEEAAEKYFNNLPNSLRVRAVYVSLLNCYVRHKSVAKAESTMQKMRELGFAKSPISYTSMLNLYYRVGDYHKLTTLVQEMEMNAIHLDVYAQSIRLNAYAANSDIERMEKLLMNIEADPHVRLDCHFYVTATNAFLKVGLKEKAVAALKKAEHLIQGDSKSFSSSYRLFLNLYAEIGLKDEVYRIWGLYKGRRLFHNAVYGTMINSLLKLDDMDGAVAIWNEWDSKNYYYDFHIPNLLIIAYWRRGLLQEAEALFNKALLSRSKPSPGTWNCMACVYSETGQMEKAVEAVKKAIMVSRFGTRVVQHFNRPVFARCVDYLKRKGDMDVAEELVNLCLERGVIPIDFHEKLLNCLRHGELGSDMSHLIGDKDLTVEADGDID